MVWKRKQTDALELMEAPASAGASPTPRNEEVKCTCAHAAAAVAAAVRCSPAAIISGSMSVRVCVCVEEISLASKFEMPARFRRRRRRRPSSRARLDWQPACAKCAQINSHARRYAYGVRALRARDDRSIVYVTPRARKVLTRGGLSDATSERSVY